jgi:hypothetical protein
VTDYLEVGRALANREANRRQIAFRTLTDSLHEPRIPLADRDLVAAAQVANDRGLQNTVSVALNELALRMAADESVEQIERAA